MDWVKFLHVLFMLIWVGQLLSLSRLLGYMPKLGEATQLEVAPYYLRTYRFVGLVCMVLALAFGVVLLVNRPSVLSGGWFHLKLTLVVLLVVVDMCLGKWIEKLTEKPEKSRGIKYKILHGVAGLLLVGILYAIYVMKPLAQQVT